MPRLVVDGKLQYQGNELAQKLVEFIGGSNEVLTTSRDQRSPYEAIYVTWLDLLKSEAGAGDLCEAVRSLLDHPDPMVRSTAIHFFTSATKSSTECTNQTLISLLEKESPLYIGAADPDQSFAAVAEEYRESLGDLLIRALWQRWQRLGPPVKALLRREALCPGRARPTIRALWQNDRPWLEAHIVSILVGTPNSLRAYLRCIRDKPLKTKTLLVSLRGSVPAATVHAAIRGVHSDDAERLISLFDDGSFSPAPPRD